MKIDPPAVQAGVGALGFVAVALLPWRIRLLQVFAAALALLVGFEWVCLAAGAEPLVWLWWLVHLPSTLALGADEILERHGRVISTAFHLGDLLLWPALIVAFVRFRDRVRTGGSVSA